MAAGSIAKVSGSGQGLPSTSFAVLDVGTIDTDPDGILTEVSTGRYRPDAEGYYLIVASGRFDSTHNNRQNILWEFQRNSTDIAGTAGSGYSRNNGNPYSYMRCGALLHFNGTSDYIELRHARDAGGGSPAGSYNNTRMKVVQLSEGDSDSLPYARYGTPTAGAYTGTTPTAIPGWDVITENDTDVIELQAGGTAIRLKEADRPYLLIYALQNDDAGAGRTTRLSDVTLDGTRVAHSGGSVYQRNNTCQNAVPFGIALMRPGSADLDVNIRCWGYDNTLAAVWGAFTFDDGSWSLSASAGDAGVMIIALPPDTNIGIYEDLTANQTVSGSTDVGLNLFRTTVDEDTPISRQSNTDVDVTAGGEYMAYAGTMVERTASSGTRNTSATRWVQEATELTAATEYGNYLRGEQAGDDTKNMWFGSLFMDTATTDDTFQIEKFDPGTDDGANDATSWGGGFFIDLASLAAPAGTVITGTAHGRASARGVTTAAVIVTATAHGRGGGRAEASAQAIVVAQAQGRSAATGAATASVLRAVAATGAATASAAVQASTVRTGTAAGRATSRASAQAAGSVVTATAHGRAASRAQAAGGIPTGVIVDGTAHGRATSSATVSATAFAPSTGYAGWGVPAGIA